MRGEERIHTHGNGVEVLIAQVDERPHKVGPSAHELEEPYRNQCRLRHRHDDAEENPKLPCPIHTGRLDILHGNAEEELAEHVNIEGGAEELRDNERPEGTH